MNVRKLTTILIMLFVASQAFNQSNNYFSHGEGWSGEDQGVVVQDYYYVEQMGDTVVNNDTLVKLTKVFGASSINRNYYLGKNNSGILTLFLCDDSFTTSQDSITIDFSRSDSVTYRRNYPNSVNYRSKAIHSIDTLYFNGVPKKRFRIYDDCGEYNDDFVYEGVFGMSESPFYDACFEYAFRLNCYSINDSCYVSNGDYNNLDFAGTGDSICKINNFGLDEWSSNLIQLSPNPSQNTIHINLSYFTNLNYSIEIKDGVGQTVLIDVMDGKEKDLNISHLKPGVYHIELKFKDKIATKSYVKL